MGEMNSKSNLSLREKAILTWIQERPIREAQRLRWQVEKINAVHEKLRKILGSEYEIKIGINSNGDITAVVEDLRFTTYNYDDDLLHIVLIVKCRLCGKDVSLGFINDIADLGEKLEKSYLSTRHRCTV